MNYFKQFKITDPNYIVMRTGGREIRKYAEKYFRGRLLDIGCGTKSKIYLIGDLVDEYTGLDHIDSLHDKSSIDIYGTAYEIPATDSSYDSILCTAVLEHLEEPSKALKEAFRILRPGGYAIYTVPLFWHIHEEPRDFFRYTRYGLKYLFEKAGFEIIEIKHLSGFWITFGSELSYYTKTVFRGPLKYITPLFIMLNNLALPIFDWVDGLFNKESEKWTWLYLLVVRKCK